MLAVPCQAAALTVGSFLFGDGEGTGFILFAFYKNYSCTSFFPS